VLGTARDYWPTVAWQNAPPEAHGLDPAVLQAFADDPHTPVNMNAQVDLLEPDERRTAIRALQQACG